MGGRTLTERKVAPKYTRRGKYLYDDKKDPRHKHPLIRRKCDQCRKWYVGRKSSRFCSLRCSGIFGTRHQSIAILGQLRCTKCDQFKPEDDFNRSARSITGRKPHCRACVAIAAAKSRTPERVERERANRLAYEATHRLELAAKARRRYAVLRAATVVRVTAEQLEARWNYWGGLCWICGKAANSWDHVKPLTKGGPHMLCNLRPACQSCNSRKSNKWPFGQPIKQRSN